MVITSCPRCGYTTHDQGNMRKHLFCRKTPCPAKVADIDMEDFLREYQDKLFHKKHECKSCNKKFAHASGLSRHRQSCSQDDDRDLRILQLEEKVKQLASMQNHQGPITIQNITNVQNNAIQNNKIINAFGKEDLSHITSCFLDRCVKRTNQGLVELLDQLHFGGDGRNRNVRITNRKIPLAEYNDGHGWRFDKKERVLNRMLDKGQDILQEHFDEHQNDIRNQLSESMWDYVQEFFQKVEVKDETVIRAIIDDIYIMLLNKSKELTR